MEEPRGRQDCKRGLTEQHHARESPGGGADSPVRDAHGKRGTFTLGHRVQRLMSISMANGIRGDQKTRKLATSYITVENPVRRIETVAKDEITGNMRASTERAQLDKQQFEGRRSACYVQADSEANTLFWQDAMALPCFASEF